MSDIPVDPVAQAQADLAAAQAELAAATAAPADPGGQGPGAGAFPEPTVRLATLPGRAYQPFPEYPVVTEQGTDVPATVAEKILAAAQAARVDVRKVD